MPNYRASIVYPNIRIREINDRWKTTTIYQPRGDLFEVSLVQYDEQRIGTIGFRSRRNLIEGLQSRRAKRLASFTLITRQHQGTMYVQSIQKNYVCTYIVSR